MPAIVPLILSLAATTGSNGVGVSDGFPAADSSDLALILPPSVTRVAERRGAAHTPHDDAVDVDAERRAEQTRLEDSWKSGRDYRFYRRMKIVGYSILGLGLAAGGGVLAGSVDMRFSRSPANRGSAVTVMIAGVFVGALSLIAGLTIGIIGGVMAAKIQRQFMASATPTIGVALGSNRTSVALMWAF